MHGKRVAASLAMSAVAAVSMASGSSGSRSSAAFVGAASAVGTPESFHARAPRCPPRSTCSQRPFPMAVAGGYPSFPLLDGAESPTSATASKALLVTGGAGAAEGAGVGTGAASGFGLASAWGVVSVVFILMNAVKRLAPIALQPFSRGDFTVAQWAMYGGFAGLMAYAEGFKGFQKKFSPLVVKRALTLDAPRSGFLRLLFAGPYSMGLFHATKKRRTVSWGLTAGVLCLVQLVKRLPYPWRSIVDAGVVVGLSYGTLSICVIWARALMGQAPTIDPALPETAPKGAAA